MYKPWSFGRFLQQHDCKYAIDKRKKHLSILWPWGSVEVKQIYRSSSSRFPYVVIFGTSYSLEGYI